MHLSGLCHRDIKSENILIDYDFVIKIADFGSAKMIKSLNKEPAKLNSLEIFGSREYNAPEIVQGAHYDGDKADIYSLAICLFVMVSGNMPFRQASIEDAHYRRFCLNKSKYWTIYKIDSSNEFKDLFERMADKAESRATLNEIKVHPWVQKVDPPELIQQELIKRLNMHSDIIRKELNELLKSKHIFPTHGSSDEDLSELGVEKSLFEDAQKDCLIINTRLPEKKPKYAEEEKESPLRGGRKY